MRDYVCFLELETYDVWIIFEKQGHELIVKNVIYSNYSRDDILENKVPDAMEPILDGFSRQAYTMK